MKKNILTIYLLSITVLLSAQVGINIKNPYGVFHIDPKNNTTSSTAGVDDDFIIDSDGNVGIGTATPTNKLTIQGSGTNTGLHLPTGASSGKVLTSDVDGNAMWVSSAVQYQTLVEGTGGKLEILDATGFPIENPYKLTFFKVAFDKVKAIYGSAYGWDNVNQHYVVPVSGLYRIAFSVYFQPIVANTLGKNNRAYIFVNGVKFQRSGFISLTDGGVDIQGYTMGLATLNKGDTIDLRVFAHSSIGKVNVYGGSGNTFLLIESL